MGSLHTDDTFKESHVFLKLSKDYLLAQDKDYVTDVEEEAVEGPPQVDEAQTKFSNVENHG